MQPAEPAASAISAGFAEHVADVLFRSLVSVRAETAADDARAISSCADGDARDAAAREPPDHLLVVGRARRPTSPSSPAPASPRGLLRAARPRAAAGSPRENEKGARRFVVTIRAHDDGSDDDVAAAAFATIEVDCLLAMDGGEIVGIVTCGAASSSDPTGSSLRMECAKCGAHHVLRFEDDDGSLVVRVGDAA